MIALNYLELSVIICDFGLEILKGGKRKKEFNLTFVMQVEFLREKQLADYDFRGKIKFSENDFHLLDGIVVSFARTNFILERF